jgi:uncharacterized protein
VRQDETISGVKAIAFLTTLGAVGPGLVRKGRALRIASLIAIMALGCGRDGGGLPPRPRRILILTGPPGGVYHPLGGKLAQIYNLRIPGVRAEARSMPGSVSNMDAVQNGDAEVAFTQADAAYEAHTGRPATGRTPRSSLRAIAALYPNVLQIMTRRDGDIRSVAGLAGRQVGIGPQGSSTELVAPVVMDAHGVAADLVHRHSLDFDEAARRVAAGSLDAAFIMASYPAGALTMAEQITRIRLLSLDREVVKDMREPHPFYRPVLISRTTHAGKPGDVYTLEVDNVLVCRADLDEELVHQLTEILFDSLSQLAQVHPTAGSIDPEQAPAAPIPLHAGAARFYRERDIFR